MFTKTICTPGAPIIVVPEGLLAVLKYNSNGQLENIQLGYDPINHQLVDNNVLSSVRSSGIIPTDINIIGATSYVYGVFYCQDDIIVSGSIPTCLREALLTELELSPEHFSFLASHPISLGANFKSHVAIRNWFELNGFKRLPSIVATTNVDDDSMLELLSHRYSEYRWPLMSGYWIENGDKYKFIPSNLSQFKIKKVKQIAAIDGIISGEIKYDTNDVTFVPWSTVIDFDLDSDTVVLTEGNKIIASRRYSSKKRDIRSREFTCPSCGKKQIIEYNQGIVECEDPNCRSKLYSKICQFIRVLNLPNMSDAQYKKYESADKITCVPDILMLPEYDDINIQCTFAKLLEAVVPPSYVPQPMLFEKFTDSCSNTMKTILYYLNSPREIEHDLQIKHPFLSKFVQWLEVPQNLLLITEALIGNPHISITFSGKRFQGAPIFRSKQICITGQFMHGSVEEIISILKSYDATVTTQFSDSVHCVLVGGTHANIDGSIIHAARQTNVPVFEELDFFKKYEIDEDLNANLQ